MSAPKQMQVPMGATLQLKGGAAIVAPAAAFPQGLPGNALVVIPVGNPSEELTEKLKQGPIVVEPDQMWQLLGFNGPAVNVQDAEGRPIAIGLEDLLGGLEQHWQEDKSDLNRGRMFAQELMKHGRFDRAEKVLSHIVANGGEAEDWLGLGVTQLHQEKWDQAEGTLRGAQNLMPDNPYPCLHLAKVAKGKSDAVAERAMVEKAIAIQGRAVDGWAYLYNLVRDVDGEDAAVATVRALADTAPNNQLAAPFIALQGFYAGDEGTRDQAIGFAEEAVRRDSKDPLALVCLSALFGQAGRIDDVVSLLQPAEPLMLRDVRLANNYFEALFQTRQIDRVTKLLNALAGSQNREVKQFAIERSRVVAQFLQQQQQRLAQAARPAPMA